MRERSCGVVIFRRTGGAPKYLVLHYLSGHWDFVKGKVEEGEDEMETVVRETKEETGIRDLKFVDGFRRRVRYVYRKDSHTVYKQVVLFLAETRTARVRLSHEHQDYAWLRYADAYRTVTFGNAKRVLRAVSKSMPRT